ncbi:hypothetical protein RO3G_14935 [Rhizopus delemar RA 99-880]|uniref:Uncharacterized protein n=1 Tax=Rhizopus delemar (strain RA 99-880 / ATCC MYA-4621 / FGSC 9543 / NRRL 43880) TaxID=246409 RepID=I1CP42_RHIO9|nr:hypothetical protein RO3G_14929 [Rhizopus delemar RA 99-880]EIE90222.1 hypothetical protein RO3G_14933 [Rhizopus delemar RA 99-880]EIE90224.1 hypothetical protein RO3G_14935 [Rhizopus delemar RA 99-880]KAG1181886.1 hypothetical protein G6F36_009577 [Rhizopus arrhizus]KAG1587658.1 hypothetical protein G6F48_005793 [Rhizopus delemar]|eukprot:EIE90218.1 hypothetical protein RO3G_14929 [Rhizopus delemar RA 99-880]
MKLSLSILLFVSALVSVQASTNPKVSPEGCIRPNNRGEGQGLGWKGYCCKTSDDCHDTCIKGKCNGPVNPKLAPSIDDDSGSKSGSGKKGGNKLCIRLNNRGDGNGLGWNGYCCKTSDDCRDTCVKGKCNGKANPKYAQPIDDDDSN